jgi:microsomal prostaglandin-E synthase 2
MKPVLTLYQYAICPYCCKLKGVLDYFRVPYNTVEVNPVSKWPLRSLDIRQKKVPFAIFSDGAFQNESSLIIESLQQRGLISGSVKPEFLALCDRLSALLFCSMTTSFQDSWQSFGYVNKVTTFSDWQKPLLHISGSLAMRLANLRLKRRHAIQDANLEIFALLKNWIENVNLNEDILEQCELYGTLQSVEGTRTESLLLKAADPRFIKWYTNFKESTKSSLV